MIIYEQKKFNLLVDEAILAVFFLVKINHLVRNFFLSWDFDKSIYYFLLILEITKIYKIIKNYQNYLETLS